MNVASRISAVTVAVMSLSSTVAVMSLSSAAVAQTPAVAGAQEATIVRMVATPASLTLQTGQSVDLTITAYDSSGAVIPDANVRVTAPRRLARYSEGKLTAIGVGRSRNRLRPGPEYGMRAISVAPARR